MYQFYLKDINIETHLYLIWIKLSFKFYNNLLFETKYYIWLPHFRMLNNFLNVYNI